MSPLIVSGGGTQPLITRKRRKEAVSPPVLPEHDATNLANLSAAHFYITGKYPSPEKAKTLLSIAGDRPRSVEDWRTLLDPESILHEATGVPTVGEAVAEASAREYDIAKREAQASDTFEPSALEETSPVTKSRWRFRVVRELEDNEDFDPILDLKGKIWTLATTGEPSELVPAPARDVGKIQATIDYIRAAQREARDADLTTVDRARHDVVVGNITQLAKELAERRKELGLENNFDASDPYGKGLINAYREYIIYSQIPAVLLNDGTEVANKRAAKALDVIRNAYSLRPGEDPNHIIDAIVGLQDTTMRLGVPSEALRDLCYRYALAGRPFGQSEVKARWDYIFTYGRDKLPPDAASKAAEEERNVYTLLEDIGKFIDPHGYIPRFMDSIDPMDGLYEKYGGDTGTAATAVKVLHWFTHGVTHLDINSLVDRPLVTWIRMLELLDGTYEIRDGLLVRREKPGPPNRDILLAMDAWQAAWDDAGGKMFVTEAMTTVARDTFGVDVEKHKQINEAIHYIGFFSEIVFGAKFDSLFRAAAKPLLMKSYLGARRAAQAYAAMDKVKLQRGGFLFGAGKQAGAAGKFERSAWGAAAEAYYRDVMSEFGGEELLQSGLPKFHPSDVADASAQHMRYVYAMDEAIKRSMREFGVKVRSGISRKKLDDMWREVLDEHPDAGSRVWDHLGDVMEERGLSGPRPDVEGAAAAPEAPTAAPEAPTAGPATASVPFEEIKPERLPSGVSVKKTSAGPVDASIAPDVEVLNRAGYKTYGSHGFPDDHPVKHPARKSEPYVEFRESDLRTPSAEIQGRIDSLEGEVSRLRSDIEAYAQERKLAATGSADRPRTTAQLMQWLRKTRIGIDARIASYLSGQDAAAIRGKVERMLASGEKKAKFGGIDRVAAYVKEHFPWFGVNDSDDLWRLIVQGTSERRPFRSPGVSGISSARKRLSELEGELEALRASAGTSRKKVSAIVRAAKKTGMTVSRSKSEGETLINVSGNNIHDFVEALTGKTVDPTEVSAPADVVAGATSGRQAARGASAAGATSGRQAARGASAAEPRNRVHWLLWNRAEVIAYYLRNPSLIARLFHIPDVPELKGIVNELAEASDPDTVVNILERLRAEGGIPQAFDAAMPGFMELVRAAGYVNNLKVGPLRLATTPIGLGGRHVTARHADQAALNMAFAFKMGKRHWTSLDREEALMYADRLFNAPIEDRMLIMDEFCNTIMTNMKLEGTWSGYEKMLDRVRKARAKEVAFEFRRAYTKGRRVVHAKYESTLERRIKEIERELQEVATEKDEPLLKKALEDARRELDTYRRAAELVNGNITPKKAGMTLETANAILDNLGSPTPFLIGELANTIRIPFDPRVMAWFHAGTPMRILQRIDNAGLDKLMQTWRMIVMSSVSFPMRVFGKDEGMRLLSEGIIPFGEKWNKMRHVWHELGGGKLALSKEEYQEFRRLREIKKPSEEQAARLAEFQSRIEGKLTQAERAEVYGEGGMDWAELLSDDFRLVDPSDPLYFKSFSHNLRKLSREPIMREFLDTGLKEPDDIREWLIHLLTNEKSEVGVQVRHFLVRTGRITQKHSSARAVRSLLASRDRVGEAGNLSAFIEDWTDILSTVSVDQRLMQAIRKPGSVPISELRKINTENLWPVPIRDDVVFGRNTGGLFGSGTWNPLRLWYEGVTLRYMEGISKALRRQMFAHEYGRVFDELTGAGISPERAHPIAFERAIAYTNRVTFVRNPSVLEDMLRNYVPFINSYRQFWRYWGRMLLRHPFAMSAAYHQNPAKDMFGLERGVYLFFGAPGQLFWQETPGGLAGVMRGNLPSVNPFIALLFSSVAEDAGVSLVGLPGFSDENAFNPLSSLRALVFGMGAENVIGMKKLVGDTRGYEREHAYLLREFASGKGKPSGEGGIAEVDWPFWVDFWNAFGLLHAKRPEFIMQGMTRILSPLGTQKLAPKRTREILEGMSLIGDPFAVAKYRATHQDFDMLQRYYEAKTPEEKDKIANLAPWVVDYSVNTIDRLEGTFTMTAADYITAHARGEIATLDDKEILRNIAAARMRHWGGYRRGNPTEFPSFKKRKEAEREMEQALKYAKQWAEKVAMTEAHGSVAYYNDLMRQWENQQPSSSGYLPGIFAEYARREAAKNGVPLKEYERHLSPVAIGEDFEAVYGDDYLLKSDTERNTDIERVQRLIDAGLGTLSQAKWWIRNTDYPEAIEAAQESLREQALKEVAYDAREEFYNLDSRKLRSMGVQCTGAIDRAIADVRNYYYNTYKPIVDKYGGSSREARDARLAMNAYKDKRFSKVQGGEAFIGGLAERIMHIPYFTRPNYASIAPGHHAPQEEGVWKQYIKEAQKRKPNMRKIRELHKHFTPYDENRYQEFMRVNNMMFTAAMAQYMRNEMKESWSDYYSGPGNSAYSKMGMEMVSKLTSIIRQLIREDKRRWGASAFAKDMYNYFETPHAFAFTALEWYYH